MYITKFFRLSDQHHFESGQIRFGTLSSYGAQETKAVMGARHDELEGISRRKFSVTDSSIGPFLIPRSIENYSQEAPIFINCTMDTVLDAHVFCASIGKFSKQGHREMLHGAENGYPGDLKLLSYAVFDLEKLLEAITIEIEKELGRHPDGNGWLYYGPVTYDKTVAEMEIKPGTNIDENAQELSVVYSKPKLFTPERENRIMIRPADGCLPIRLSVPRFFQSKLIYNSIVEFGPFSKS